MKYFLLISVLVFCSVTSIAQHGPAGEPVAGSSLNSGQWLQDIDFLQKEILRLHPDPFYKNKDLDKEKFDGLFNELRKNIAIWDEDKIVTEITRIIGLMNDGHSAIDHYADNKSFYDFRFFPLWLYYFPEGLHAIGAPEGFKYLIGKKLVAINNMSIEDVIKRMRPIISKDYGNTESLRDAIRYFVTISQYLHGLGIINDPAEAVYTFIGSDGIKTDAKLKVATKKDLFAAFDRSGNDGKPLYRQDPSKFYWFKYLDVEKTVYIKYNSELVDKALSPAEFCKKIQSVIDTAPFQKVILDLRQNQGGNILTLKPVYDFLMQPRINQKGKLYVLIDRRSQSAGTVMAIRLSMISKAIIVGAPAVNAPNFFDNDNKFPLPNSKIRVGISTHFLFAGFPVDDRIEYTADIPMDVTAKDYFQMKDPVLDFAIAHKVSPENIPSGIVVDKNIEGAYQYSITQLLTIKKNDTDLRMVIEDGRNGDFLNTSMYPVSPDFFQTDINGLTVSYSNDKLIFNTKWGKMEFDKLPEDYMSPQQLINIGKIDQALTAIQNMYHTVKHIDLKTFEAAINSWGYLLVNKREIDNASRLFVLNTQLFPGSSNTWDSLGEVYALAGNKTEAIRCYNKALELTPGLISATEALKKLQ